MFSSFGQLIAGLLQIGSQRPVQPEIKRRGLHYPPEGGDVYASHKDWAGHQRPTTEGFMALGLAATNPAIHRCRIGKITLKPNA